MKVIFLVVSTSVYYFNMFVSVNGSCMRLQPRVNRISRGCIAVFREGPESERKRVVMWALWARKRTIHGGLCDLVISEIDCKCQ